MTDTMRDALPRAGAGWGWMLAYGILSLALALFAFVDPLAATYAATLIVGVLLIVAGIGSIVAGAQSRGHEGRGYAILFGVLSIVVGAIIALEPATGAISITILVAAWLAARGVLELVWGARMRRGRGWMLALGVLNIALAVLIVLTVGWSALVLPGYILALSFLFGGITATAAALQHRQGAPTFG